MLYRGYDIEQRNPYVTDYEAIDPDADYDWVGDPGSYYQCSGLPTHNANTLEDVKIEIDEFWNGVAMDLCHAFSGWGSPDYMEFYGLDLASL